MPTVGPRRVNQMGRNTNSATPLAVDDDDIDTSSHFFKVSKALSVPRSHSVLRGAQSDRQCDSPSAILADPHLRPRERKDTVSREGGFGTQVSDAQPSLFPPNHTRQPGRLGLTWQLPHHRGTSAQAATLFPW